MQVRHLIWILNLCCYFQDVYEIDLFAETLPGYLAIVFWVSNVDISGSSWTTLEIIDWKKRFELNKKKQKKQSVNQSLFQIPLENGEKEWQTIPLSALFAVLLVLGLVVSIIIACLGLILKENRAVMLA